MLKGSQMKQQGASIGDVISTVAPVLANGLTVLPLNKDHGALDPLEYPLLTGLLGKTLKMSGAQLLRQIENPGERYFPTGDSDIPYIAMTPANSSSATQSTSTSVTLVDDNGIPTNSLSVYNVSAFAVNDAADRFYVLGETTGGFPRNKRIITGIKNIDTFDVTTNNINPTSVSVSASAQRCTLQCSPSGVDLMYAAIQEGTPDSIVTYLSTNGGSNYTNVAAMSFPLITTSAYIEYMRISRDLNTTIMLERPGTAFGYTPRLMRSLNKGAFSNIIANVEAAIDDELRTYGSLTMRASKDCQTIVLIGGRSAYYYDNTGVIIYSIDGGNTFKSMEYSVESMKLSPADTTSVTLLPVLSEDGKYFMMLGTKLVFDVVNERFYETSTVWTGNSAIYRGHSLHAELHAAGNGEYHLYPTFRLAAWNAHRVIYKEDYFLPVTHDRMLGIVADEQ